MTQASVPQSGGATIVVVPCYNEARRLDFAAYDAFLARSVDVSLLFVDDGSTDDTPLVIERLRQRHPRRVLTLRLGANVGKAEAVRRGMLLAIRRRANFAGYWDADLATPLDAVLRFRSVLLERPEILLVMGSRVALLGRQIRRRWRRHLLGRAFATAASFVLGLTVYDTQCGAKLFRVTPETTELFRQPFDTRWIFDVEILARMVQAKRLDAIGEAADVVYEYPLERWQDVQGSRLQPFDFLVAAMDLVAIYWRNRRGVSQIGESAQASGIEHPAPGIQHRDAA
ncbi:MAG: glycosyltransferase [Planctomycetes bacterium]|nr:glycosyltransferase [Planctomycetota bacterium]